MHRLALLAALTASQVASAERHPVYISIGADALGTVTSLAGTGQGELAQLHLLAADDDVAVLEADEADLEVIAREMHERHGRCGGFIVHDTRDEAIAALDAAPLRRDSRPPIDYTLDRTSIVEAVLPTVDRTRIAHTILQLQGMQSRYFKSASGTAASEWIAAEWRGLSARSDVTVELVDHKSWPQRSVILTIPGASRPDEVIVIGGHLDSISLAGSTREAPGADDDASGIATLTEVARALLAADYRPSRTIKFMAYAAEEVGLRGSQAIAKDFARRRVNVVGALQLDMTNYQGSDRDIWLMKDFTSASQNTFLIQLIERYVGATYGLDACGYACSDHASWHRIGVPVSMPFEARMKDRNMAIHTAGDTLETSGNNADHAVKFARLGAAYAIELGKGSLGPTVEQAPEPTVDGSSTDVRAPVHPPGLPARLVLTLLALLAGAGLWLQRRQ